MYSLGLINGKVYQNGQFLEENIFVKDGIIKEIVEKNTILPCEKTIDCVNKIILPGFIDPHVHINLNLGEFQSSDDYETASKAAAFGGITTFIDFLEPINHIDEFNEKLKQKIKEAKRSFIDYSFHTTLGNFEDDVKKLSKISKKSGIPTIKIFTTYSESDRRISYEKLKELLSESRKLDFLVLAHTENDKIILESKAKDRIEDYPLSRPEKAEIKEVDKLAHYAKEFDSNLYFVHITCGTSVNLLKEKYSDILKKNIFIESCPQYFYLTNKLYKTEKGNLFLLAPPLRSSEENEKLKQNIDNIDTIGTDHCPFLKEEKCRYQIPSKIPKGLGGLEYSFSLMYNLYGERIIDKFSINPAKIHRLFPKKGVIQEGSDADLVIFDNKEELIIGVGHSNTDYSPYEGIKVKGVIESTILRGEFVVKNRKFVGEKRGKFINRDVLSN